MKQTMVKKTVLNIVVDLPNLLLIKEKKL